MPDTPKEKKYPFLDADDASEDGTADNGASSDDNDSSSDGDADFGVDNLNFDDDEVGEKLRYAQMDVIDKLNFGVIKVDDEGEVEFFSKYESDLSGVAKEQAEGRNFFTQVAPCTNNRLFRGRFKKGVRRGELDETFTYTYTYKMRPTLVDVHLYRDAEGNNWIMVQKY